MKKIKKLCDSKWNIARMLLLAILLVASVNTFTGIVSYADKGREDAKDEIGNKSLGLNKLAADLWFTVQENMQNIAGDIADRVKLDDSECEIATTLWDDLAAFAYLLAITYFIIDMNKNVLAAQSSWSIQQLANPLLKLGAILFIIDNGKIVVDAVKEVGNSFIDLCKNSLAAGTPETILMKDDMVKMIKDLKLGPALVFVIAMLLTWIISCIVRFIFLYKSIVYKIELVLRVAITPIVLGDFWEGKNSAGVRWLKKLFGVFMYGGSFILILIIGAKLAEVAAIDVADSTNVWDFILGTVYACAIPFAQVGALGAAKSACSEIMA